MSMEISIALRAEQDLTLQYRWYLENADLDVAERYLSAVHETILKIAERPDLGCRRRFQAPELSHIRSIQVKKPFDRHLLFYMEGNPVRIERVMHGARDLANRLLEDPEG
jgi:plasmid stabilization system protein ParE